MIGLGDAATVAALTPIKTLAKSPSFAAASGALGDDGPAFFVSADQAVQYLAASIGLDDPNFKLLKPYLARLSYLTAGGEDSLKLIARARLAMGIGVGIDLLEIERLERALERHPRLGRAALHRGRAGLCPERARPGRHLAARFAAKEAVIKALGLRRFGVRDIEIVAGEPPRSNSAAPRPKPPRAGRSRSR